MRSTHGPHCSPKIPAGPNNSWVVMARKHKSAKKRKVMFFTHWSLLQTNSWCCFVVMIAIIWLRSYFWVLWRIFKSSRRTSLIPITKKMITLFCCQQNCCLLQLKKETFCNWYKTWTCLSIFPTYINTPRMRMRITEEQKEAHDPRWTCSHHSRLYNLAPNISPPRCCIMEDSPWLRTSDHSEQRTLQ